MYRESSMGERVFPIFSYLLFIGSPAQRHKPFLFTQKALKNISIMLCSYARSAKKKQDFFFDCLKKKLWDC